MPFKVLRQAPTVLSFLLALIMFVGSSAQAGEGLFSRAYTVETVPEGHYELEQTIRNRDQRAFGQYSAFDLKSEFEYGILDQFQAALYVNSEYLHAKGSPDDNDSNGETGFDRDNFVLQSLSTEFIYRVSSPVTSPIGVAFYLEPEWDFYDMHNLDKEYSSMETEFRVLFQKNFFEDQLILVYNFVLEAEYFRYSRFGDDGKDTLWQGELDWNNELGATYRFAQNWYGGLEFRNHNENGNFWSHDHSVYWVGPAFHYGGPRFWATLGELVQFTGNPNGPDAAGSDQGTHLFLHSHEQFETTLKFAYAF